MPDVQLLPIITQPAATPSPLDAQQFIEVPVIAISDSMPTVRGQDALFTISLLDSPGPLTVRISAGSILNFGDAPPDASDPTELTPIYDNYLGFSETIVLTQPETVISIPTINGTPDPPDVEYFNVYLEAVGVALVVRPLGVGTIVAAVDYVTYLPGVYESTPDQTYL